MTVLSSGSAPPAIVGGVIMASTSSQLTVCAYLCDMFHAVVGATKKYKLDVTKHLLQVHTAVQSQMVQVVLLKLTQVRVLGLNGAHVKFFLEWVWGRFSAERADIRVL